MKTKITPYNDDGTYAVTRHKGAWYVIGRCGGNYWMIVSDSLPSKSDAIKHQIRQHRIDADARRCAANI